MNLNAIIEILKENQQQLTVVWDSTVNLLQCDIKQEKGKQKQYLNVDIKDFVVDHVIDKIIFNTQVNEFTKGNGEIFIEDDSLWFKYKAFNKFRRQSESENMILDFIHPPEIERYLNRSRLHFLLSINEKGFVRQSIKPEIDEGDAYTLGTHILEKYRGYFQNVLKEEFDNIHKEKNAIDYELVLTSTVTSLKDKVFGKVIVWYELFEEQVKVQL